jgi:hypothetical protein
MKFELRGNKVHELSNGGLAVINSHGQLLAYKVKNDGDLKNWSWVRKNL